MSSLRRRRRSGPKLLIEPWANFLKPQVCMRFESFSAHVNSCPVLLAHVASEGIGVRARKREAIGPDGLLRGPCFGPGSLARIVVAHLRHKPWGLPTNCPAGI